MRRNVVYGALLNKVGLKIVLEANKIIITRNGDFVGKGYVNNGLFVLNTIEMNNIASSSAYIVESLDLWLGRLGHLNFGSIKRLRNMNLIPSISEETELKCPICVEAKHFKKPFKSISKRQTELLELVHSDLADFKNSISRGGKRYYVTFVDDFSRYTKVYLLRSKDEAETMFLKYKAEVENQLDKKIKRLRTDRGGEYNTNSLREFCEKNGIIHEFTAPYSPQQNGIAERKNRTLKNMMNAMLINSGMSNNMWGEAILIACYILNKVPHKRLDKTPYEMWKGHPPNLKFLKMWGCLAKVGIPNFKVSNVGTKTFDTIFIGYAHNSAAYRFLCLSDNSVIESRDAEFFENIFPFKKLDSTSKNDVSKLHAFDSNNSKNIEPRRSKRQRTETSFGPDFITAFLTEIIDVDILSEELIYSYMLEEDPRTYEEAIKLINSNLWKEA